MDKTVMNTIEKSVACIIEEVRRQGDRALIRLTRKFDRVTLAASALRVSSGEMARAVRVAGPEFKRMVREIALNIEEYHRRQLPRPAFFTNRHGARVGWRYAPVARAGVYLPAGTAPLVSTALMTIVPARVAGVEEIIVATPPGMGGQLNPFLLAACRILGVSRVVRVGGAQAIAALAYGTKSVPAVDLIVGPGNVFVTEAKRQLAGKVGIDMTAGPSEVAIIADEKAEPACIAADLLSQAEHDTGSVAVLFTPSARLIARVREELGRQEAALTRTAVLSRSARKGIRLVRCNSLEDAVRRSNAMAPEHLEIITRAPERLAGKVRNAGAIFLGAYSATALGDYVAGPSHVLPTGGTARFYSVLSVDTFMKRISLLKYDRASLKRAYRAASRLAEIEGLDGHARALAVRMAQRRAG
ncbi:MAG: histidinol dehydrogenase [Candidatus Aureabacteria bacterium]|nr:histidinol dehydrogenase [Candidatus Auribacterota bacterium]